MDLLSVWCIKKRRCILAMHLVNYRAQFGLLLGSTLLGLAWGSLASGSTPLGMTCGNPNFEVRTGKDKNINLNFKQPNKFFGEPTTCQKSFGFLCRVSKKAVQMLSVDFKSTHSQKFNQIFYIFCLFNRIDRVTAACNWPSGQKRHRLKRVAVLVVRDANNV